ncbi:hypothetical protein MHYP_G00000090 [Metynnis hypsauchen]
MCFLCLWDSRDDANHYKVKKWPDRVQHTVGKHQALVDPKKIYLPPLHIKLGLFKNFKAMDHNSDGFKYLKQKFGEVQRDAKLKAGIFDGPQVSNTPLALRTGHTPRRAPPRAPFGTTGLRTAPGAGPRGR